MTAATRRITARSESISGRVAALDWTGIATERDAHGCAAAGPLLMAGECESLVALYDDEDTFRSRVVMARHGFGRGEYKYFAYPLPHPVAPLRASPEGRGRVEERVATPQWR